MSDVSEDLEYLEERVERLERALRRIQGAAGLPDPLEACRVILQHAREVLGEGDDPAPGEYGWNEYKRGKL